MASGTYKPGNTSSSTYTISDPNPLAIYGGFQVGATGLSQCNPSAHPTILSGVIEACNIETIVTINGGNITLGGLTITGANNQSGPGGGILDNDATLTITNDIFTNNRTGIDPGEWGGAIASFNSNLTIINSTFIGNSARDGGAVSALGDPALTIISSVFKNNTAYLSGGGGFGGAVYVTTDSFPDSYANTVSITSTTFDHNSDVAVTADAVGDRGEHSHFWIQNLNVSNDVFTNNTALIEGAAGGAYKRMPKILTSQTIYLQITVLYMVEVL